MQKIASLAATAGLLVVGLAGCAKTNDNAGGNQPAPAVSAAAADAESCAEAKALSLVAGLGMAGVGLAVELKGQTDAAEQLGTIMEQLAKAKADVTDPQVKAIVDEYATTLDGLKKQMETPGADTVKLSGDIDVATAKFEKAEEKLAAICVEPSAAPGGGANSARAAACAKIEKASLELMGPFMELGMAGTDRAALDAAVKKLNTALDAYAAELTKATGETSDAELKAAITAAAADVSKIKQAVSGAKDIKALQELIDSPTFGASQEKLQSLCTS